MQPQDDLATTVANRDGWIMDGKVARFGPTDHGWSAWVRHTIEPPRLVDRWHVSIRDAADVARYTLMARTPLVAVRFAEAVIRSREQEATEG
jgi:hypothetical protein